jgi:hypothetical protein
MKKFTVRKQLVTDNGRAFGINDDISFTVLNPTTNCYDRYIGTVKEITDHKLILTNVEINRRYDTNIVVDLDDITDNSCNYVSK